MYGQRILLTPGPTLVDPRVLNALNTQPPNHVSPEFNQLHGETLEMLKPIFGTRGQVLLIPGSGTSAMELALRIACRPGQKALVLKTGYFAGYLQRGLERLGCSVAVEEAPLGEGFDEKRTQVALDRTGDVDLVALQQVDTGTSVANDVKGVAKAAKRRGAMVLVDAVASAAGMEMSMDQWGVDVVFTGSQKALATPPGLGIVALREGLEPAERGDSLYFDIPLLLREMESTQNYFITPAVNLVRALHESLRIIREEGLGNRYRRHEAQAKAVRAALRALEIDLVAKEPFNAPTVTAAYLPQGVDWPRLYKAMVSRGVELAGGLGELKGKIFRIGHMGQVDASELVAAIAALERSLRELGYSVELGSGLSAFQALLWEQGY